MNICWIVEEEVSELKKISKQELLNFFEKYIGNKESRKKLTLQQYSQKWENKIQNFQKEPLKSSIIIQNIDSFKRKMPLFPSSSNNNFELKCFR